MSLEIKSINPITICTDILKIKIEIIVFMEILVLKDWRNWMFFLNNKINIMRDNRVMGCGLKVGLCTKFPIINTIKRLINGYARIMTSKDKKGYIFFHGILYIF